MIQRLVLALSIVACLMLLVGERLGLPAGWMLPASGAILAIAVTMTAVSAATSRLQHFARVGEVEFPLGVAITGAVVLAAVWLAVRGQGNLRSEPVMSAILLAAGFLVGALMAANHSGTQHSGTQARSGRVRVAFFRFLRAVIACALLWLLWAPLTAWFSVIRSGLPLSPMLGLAILVVMPLVLGGGPALRRVALMGAAIALLFLLPPFLIEASRIVPEALDLMTILQGLGGIDGLGIEAHLRDHTETSAIVFGVGAATGLVMAPGWHMVDQNAETRERLARLPGLLGAALVFVLGVVVVEALKFAGAALGGEILSLPPGQWPDFAYSEPLRGWLRLCTIAPARIDQALAACPAGISVSTVEPALSGPALAQARGWPVMFGMLWPLTGLLVVLTGAGLLAHRLAMDAAQLVFVQILNPRALRTWQLAMIRLVILAAFGAFVMFSGQLPPPHPDLVHLMLAATGLLALASLVPSRSYASMSASPVAPPSLGGVAP